MSTTAITDIIPAAQAGSLAGLLLERVRRTPDGVAYIQYDPTSATWDETSWTETSHLVARWQAGLSREDLSTGDRVAVMMPNRREWAHFDLAALGLGLVVVPLYPNDRPENLSHVLRDSGTRLLLLQDAEQLDALAEIGDTLNSLIRILILGDGLPTGNTSPNVATLTDWLPKEAGKVVNCVTDPNALATIVYTSGATGAPKGVMLSHRNILWNAQASLQQVPAFASDRFLSFLPMSHALERTGGYYLPMMAGAAVAYARSVPQFADDLQSMRPTVLIAVPHIFARVHSRIRENLEASPGPARRLFEIALRVGWHAFEHAQGRRNWSPKLLAAPLLDRIVGRKIREHLGGCIRVAVCGGAPLPPEIGRFFVSLGVPVVQGYGLTESSPVLTVNTLRDNVPASVGLALPDTELRIGPDDELIARSPGIMQGYWNNPEATAEVLDADGWLHTGDQARIENGHCFITGRLKEIIVLATGEKVPPLDMELAIATDPLFSQVLVIGEQRPHLAALVVLKPSEYEALAEPERLDEKCVRELENPRLEEILLQRIAERLSGFPGYATIPRVAVAVDPWTIETGTMTPTMKLKRNRIAQRMDDAIERLYAANH